MEEIILCLSLITLFFAVMVIYNTKTKNEEVIKETRTKYYTQQNNNVFTSYFKQRSSDFYNHHLHQNESFQNDKHKNQTMYQETTIKEKEKKKEKDYKSFEYISNNTIEKQNRLPHYNKKNINNEIKKHIPEENNNIYCCYYKDKKYNYHGYQAKSLSL